METNDIIILLIVFIMPYIIYPIYLYCEHYERIIYVKDLYKWAKVDSMTGWFILPVINTIPAIIFILNASTILILYLMSWTVRFLFNCIYIFILSITPNKIIVYIKDKSYRLWNRFLNTKIKNN